MQQRQRVAQLSKVPLFANCSKREFAPRLSAGPDGERGGWSDVVCRGRSIGEPVPDPDRIGGRPQERAPGRTPRAWRSGRRTERDPWHSANRHGGSRNAARMARARSAPRCARRSTMCQASGGTCCSRWPPGSNRRTSDRSETLDRRRLATTSVTTPFPTHTTRTGRSCASVLSGTVIDVPPGPPSATTDVGRPLHTPTQPRTSNPTSAVR